MKTKNELNALKEEVEAESQQHRELTDEELAQVTGGGDPAGPVVPEPDPTGDDDNRRDRSPVR